MADAEKRNTPGPKPQRVKTDDNFDTVIQRALKKKSLRTVRDEGVEDNPPSDTPESGKS